MNQRTLIAGLSSRRVFLDDLRPEDYRVLYELSLDPQVRWRWEPSNQGGSFEAFAQRLWDGVFSQYLIRLRRDGNPIAGLIRCYGANFRHQTAQLSLFVAGHAQHTGAGMEACALYIDWLFNHYPFRKIYSESIDFNYQQFSSGEDRYFRVEGRLKNHELHNGQYCDNVIMAFERDHFQLHGARLAARLRQS